MKNDNISIIGAGPAGLSAAYFLTKKEIIPSVYEAGKDIGGLGGSFNFSNKSFDIGPHIFLESSQKEAVEFWKEMGGKDLITMELTRGMVLNNKLIAFPPTPLGVLNAFGIFKFSLAAISAVIGKIVRKKNFNNSGEFFQNQYGNYFRKIIFNPFCEKYMGISDLQVDSNFATSLTSFVQKSGKTNVVTDDNKLKTLIYPKQGTKIIWHRVAEKITDYGKLIFEKKLNKIVAQDKRITKLCFSDGSEINPDFVISSLPVVSFLQLMENTPLSILEAAKKLKYRNTILVYIKILGEVCDFHYVTAFDHSIEAGRITNFNKWQLQSLANNKETFLCVEYWCNSEDSNWKSNNGELISKAVLELKKTKIIRRGEIIEADVLRIEKSHPILNLEHISVLKQINQHLQKFENLILAGRHATFKWDGQADNISAGIKIAEKVSSYCKSI